MNLTLSVSPSRALRCEAVDHADQPHAAPSIAVGDEAQQAIAAAFARSAADGLLRLAEPDLACPLPPEFVFWRTWALRLLGRVTQLDEDQLDGLDAGKPIELAPPDALQLEVLVADAPPMRGLEYLDAETLKETWVEMADALRGRARKAKGGIRMVLRKLNPNAHLVGRVTFHLAENKRDSDRPFAFLATYANRLSSQARVKHLPLGEALRQYASKSDHAKLAQLLAPVRDAASESPLVRELLDSHGLFQPQAWTIAQAHRFLREVPVMEASGLVVRVPDWWSERGANRPTVQVRIGQQATSAIGLGALMDFSADLVVGGQPLSDEERRALLSNAEGLMLLRGRWVEVDSQKLEQTLAHWKQLRKDHAGGIEFLEGMRLLAAADVVGRQMPKEEITQWTGVTAGDWLAETLARLHDPSTIEGCNPGEDLRATLRPYQIEGVRWLWLITRLGLGGCLADDMGLGKTIQVIDLILRLVRQRSESGAPRQHFLLVVPASLIGNWKQELTRFAPQLSVLLAHHSESDAETLQRLAKSPAKMLADVDVVVTSYHTIRKATWPTAMRWRLAVIDEAQAIKNAGSAQSRAVRKLPADCRIALTGTPVENQLADLWSLFDFCCPGLLGTVQQFRNFVKQLEKRQEAGAYGSLRRLVQPYILRRMKTDPHIVPDLPDKTEMSVDCGLTRKQATLYEQYLKTVSQQLSSADGIRRRGIVLAMLMRLKQLCNHPDQFLGQDDFAGEESGKFMTLAELCGPILQRQEKALIFTQFQTLCEPLMDFLRALFGCAGVVLHGSVPVKRRGEIVRRFQAEDSLAFMIVSVKAGGTGLNLTAASHVIHFDRWWNPAVENQATDRAFRIGQKRNVLVHKFVCRGTVEERIDQMIRDKQALAEEILGDGGDQLLTEMSTEELMRFISLDVNRALVEE